MALPVEGLRRPRPEPVGTGARRHPVGSRPNAGRLPTSARDEPERQAGDDQGSDAIAREHGTEDDDTAEVTKVRAHEESCVGPLDGNRPRPHPYQQSAPNVTARAVAAGIRSAGASGPAARTSTQVATDRAATTARRQERAAGWNLMLEYPTDPPIIGALGLSRLDHLPTRLPLATCATQTTALDTCLLTRAADATGHPRPEPAERRGPLEVGLPGGRVGAWVGRSARRSPGSA